jgi:hypothetical protein
MPNPALRKPINDATDQQLSAAHLALSSVFGRMFLLLPQEQRKALVILILDSMDEDAGTPLDAALTLVRRIGGDSQLPSFAWTLAHTPRVRVAH